MGVLALSGGVLRKVPIGLSAFRLMACQVQVSFEGKSEQ